MNEDQPPPGAEPQRRGSSRNSIGLTNAPGDLQATWGPTQTHLLLTQNHSSPLQLQSQAEASPLPTLLPTRAVRGLRPPQTPKTSPTGSGAVGGEGLVDTELLLLLLLGWSNSVPPAPHCLKAGGTPCSLSAVLHSPRARFPHRASFQELQCSVEFHLLPRCGLCLQRKGHPVLGTEEAVNVHSGSRPPHVSFREPALFLRALASLQSHSAQPGT